jgi:hypothetical protein
MQRLVHAARVVKREPHGDSSPVIFKCFAESIRQSGEPPDAAVPLGRNGGKKGGPSRPTSMTPEEQSESAQEGRKEATTKTVFGLEPLVSPYHKESKSSLSM